MLLNDARREARFDDGEMVLLADYRGSLPSSKVSELNSCGDRRPATARHDLQPVAVIGTEAPSASTPAYDASGDRRDRPSSQPLVATAVRVPSPVLNPLMSG